METGQRRRPIEVRRSGPVGPSRWTDEPCGSTSRVSTIGGRCWCDRLKTNGPPPFEIDPTSRHGDSYEFAIERQARNIVRVAGHVVPVTLLVPAEGARAPVRLGESGGTIEIVSPMPGRIVKVLVKAGDAVVRARVSSSSRQ